jgi:hypothetical protein
MIDVWPVIMGAGWCDDVELLVFDGIISVVIMVNTFAIISTIIKIFIILFSMQLTRKW